MVSSRCPDRSVPTARTTRHCGHRSVHGLNLPGDSIPPKSYLEEAPRITVIRSRCRLRGTVGYCSVNERVSNHRAVSGVLRDAQTPQTHLQALFTEGFQPGVFYKNTTGQVLLLDGGPPHVRDHLHHLLVSRRAAVRPPPREALEADCCTHCYKLFSAHSRANMCLASATASSCDILTLHRPMVHTYMT